MPAVLPTLLPGPVDWRAVFGRTAPLEVELGFGRPHFLLERALEAPGSDVVGIEWKGKWPRAVWAKQGKGEALNVRAVHGNAWLLFGALFSPSTVSAAYLNFPDPWWKTKHRKRRVFRGLAFSSGRIVPCVTVMYIEYFPLLKDVPLVSVFSAMRM